MLVFATDSVCLPYESETVLKDVLNMEYDVHIKRAIPKIFVFFHTLNLSLFYFQTIE